MALPFTTAAGRGIKVNSSKLRPSPKAPLGASSERWLAIMSMPISESVVECLPSMHEILLFNSQFKKKKKERRGKGERKRGKGKRKRKRKRGVRTVVLSFSMNINTPPSQPPSSPHWQ
jgi:hypothetical protein